MNSHWSLDHKMESAETHRQRRKWLPPYVQCLTQQCSKNHSPTDGLNQFVNRVRRLSEPNFSYQMIPHANIKLSRVKAREQVKRENLESLFFLQLREISLLFFTLCKIVRWSVRQHNSIPIQTKTITF